MFRLVSPDAPGLWFVGAQFDPESFGLRRAYPAVSASGKGTHLAAAGVSCLCEGAELLSQLAWGDESLSVATAPVSATDEPAELMGFLEQSEPATPLRWIMATRMADGAQVRVPAALCLRQLEPPETLRPLVKLSSGCGAGPTKEHALLHGLLELVERDAVALWWLGGRRGRRLPAEAAEKAELLLAQLRRTVRSGVTWLLDISTDLGIPCVVALSTDTAGRGLVCGFSAHLAYEAAIRAAILEMCQMELGLHVIDLKVAQDGESSLVESERRHRERALHFDARTCVELQPVDGADAAPEYPHRDGDRTAWLRERLARNAIEAYVVDLSRPRLGIPVMQVLAPRLQPMPSKVVTHRLAVEIERSGGGFGLTNAIELI